VSGYFEVSKAGKALEKKFGSKKKDVVNRQFFVTFG
jgi:hypothetical protein